MKKKLVSLSVINKIKVVLVATLLLGVISSLYIGNSSSVLAACGSDCAVDRPIETSVNTGGVDTGVGIPAARQLAQLDEQNPIVKEVLKPLTVALSAAFGVIVVISLILSGIQYSAAQDNPQMVAKSKNRIFMSLLSVAIFIVGVAVLQWLVPGGLF